MRVLVTGATGYIGSVVCSVLKAEGMEPIGLARSGESASVLATNGYEFVKGDLTDHASLQSAAASADAVIHTAMDWSPGAGARDRAAVETLLAALAGSAKPFVYTSGTWVMGGTNGRINGEASALHPPARVAWRPAVEELVLKAAGAGVRAMVIRPGMVYGRRRGFLAGLFQSARDHGAVRITGPGDNHWSTVHIDDLAGLYALMVAEPAPGELFIACGGMPQPVSKIARAVAKACGIDGKVASIPLEEARQTMGDRADCLVLDCRAASTKAARFFGWTVRHPSVFDEIFSGSYLS